MPSTTKLFLGALSLLALLSLSAGTEAGAICELVPVAHAQNAGVSPTQNVANTIGQVAAHLITGMQFLSYLIFYILTFLLDPKFIIGVVEAQGPDGNILLKIWQQSRNIMNVILAFTLVMVAIATVIRGSNEYFQKYFIRLIIAAVLINFSWFFPRVILDVANVLTATIYKIPASEGAPPCSLPDSDDGCKIYGDFRFFRDAQSIANSEQDLDGNSTPVCDAAESSGCFECVLQKNVCYRKGAYDNEANTPFGILNGLVINHGRLANLARVLPPDDGPDENDEGLDLFSATFFYILQTVFTIVLMAMLFLPLAAMVVAFIIRIPVIWLTIAFMPFMFIGFILQGAIPGTQFDANEIFKKFVTAAFLPAIVAVPFAVGFIMLNAIANVECESIEFLAPVCQTTGPLLFGVNTLWSFIWMNTAFFVIWTGVFMALSADTISSKFTDGIKGFGSNIGNAAFKGVLAIPNIPVPKVLDTHGDPNDGITKIPALLNFPRRALNRANNAGLGGGVEGAVGPNSVQSIQNNGKDTAILKDILNATKRNAAGKIDKVDLRAQFTVTNGKFDNARLETISKDIEKKTGKALNPDKLFNDLINSDIFRQIDNKKP